MIAPAAPFAEAEAALRDWHLKRAMQSALYADGDIKGFADRMLAAVKAQGWAPLPADRSSVGTLYGVAISHDGAIVASALALGIDIPAVLDRCDAAAEPQPKPQHESG